MMDTLFNSFPVKVIMSELFWGLVILSLVLWLVTLGFLVYIYLVKARDFQSQIDRIESMVSHTERLMISDWRRMMRDDINSAYDEMVFWGLDDVDRDEFAKKMDELIASLPIPYGCVIDSVKEIAGSYGVKVSAAIDIASKILYRKIAEGNARFELYTQEKGYMK